MRQPLPKADLAGTVAGGLAIVGLPAILIAVVGSPAPAGTDLRTAWTLHYFSHRLDAQLASWVGWAVWAYLLVLVVSEVVSRTQGRPSRSLAARAPGGAMARGLATAILAAASLIGRQSSPAAVFHAAPAAAVSLVAAPAPAPVLAPTYTVLRGDSLWRIAEDHLGDALAWREIWDANRDRDMGGGEIFTDPSLILPGWVLEFPSAIHVGTTPPPPSPSPASAPPARPVSTAPIIPATAPAGPITTAAPTVTPASVPPAAHPDRAGSGEVGRGIRSPSREEAGVILEAVAGLGLGAAGIGAALAKAARVRARRRRRGKRVTPIPAGASAVVAGLFPAEDEDPSAWVRAALRLAAQVARAAGHTAVLRAVVVRATGLELVWDRDIEPARPFGAAGAGRWVLKRSLGEKAAFASEEDRAFPMLARIGETAGGDEVLVNLESAGSWSIAGDTAAATEVVTALSVELASSVFAGFLDVVGLGVDPSAFEHGRSEDDPGRLIANLREAARFCSERLAGSGSPSMPEARLAGLVELWEPSVVVLGTGVGPALSAELADLARSSGFPAAVIGANLAGAAESFRLSAEGLSVPFLDLVVRPSRLSEDVLSGLESVLVAVAEAPDIGADEPPFAELRAESQRPAAETAGEIRLLGPVEIPWREPRVRNKVAEIVAYVALHLEGTTKDSLVAAIWPERAPSPEAVDVRVSEARRALGTAPDGTPLLSHGPKLALHESLTTDWSRFQQLAVADLTLRKQALELVRGMPMSGIKSEWFSAEGWASEMTALAEEVGRACLTDGDLAGAERYAGLGLAVFRNDERLQRIRMEASAHSRARLDAVMAETESLAGGGLEPLDTVEAETIELYKELIQRSDLSG